jgi:hypothetical protein
MPDATRRKYRALVTIAAVVVLAGVAGAVAMSIWGNVKVVPKPPGGKEPPPLPTTTVSHLSLTLDASISAIAALLEKVVPARFPLEEDFNVPIFNRVHASAEGGGLARSPIALQVDAAHKRVQVKNSVSGRIRVKNSDAAFIKANAAADVSGSIDGSFSPEVLKDWRVDPHLQLSIGVGGVLHLGAFGNKDITGLISAKVAEVRARIEDELKKKLARELDRRADAERLWNGMNSIHKVWDQPPVWVRITPKQATYAQMTYGKDSLQCGASLEMEARVFVQRDAPNVLKSQFPDLAIADKTSDDFDLLLPFEVSYGAINDQLRLLLCGREFDLAGAGSVSLTKATIEPYGSGILVIAEFKGKRGWFKSASGTLYIVGEPVFDAAKATLRLDNLKYTVETEDVLREVAEWLWHSTLLAEMQKVAVVQLSEEMKKAKETANEQVKKLLAQLPKEVTANVKVADVRVERLAFAKPSAFAIVHASGKMSARLGN